MGALVNLRRFLLKIWKRIGIQYLQIEVSEKYDALNILSVSNLQMNEVHFIRVLILQLNEFLQSQQKQILSSAQKVFSIIVIADKKKINAVCTGDVIYVSLWFKLNTFFSLVLFSPRIHKAREKKPISKTISCSSKMKSTFFAVNEMQDSF